MTSSPHSQYLWQRWTVNGTTVISCSLGVNDVSVVSRRRRRHLAKSLRAGVHHGGKCVYVTSRCDDELHKAAVAAAAPPRPPAVSRLYSCVRRSLGRRRRSRRSIKSPIQQLMASCKPHRQQLRSVCAFSCSARFSVEYRLYQFVIITATCTVYHSLTFHSGL